MSHAGHCTCRDETYKWSRKDNRVEVFSCVEDTITNVQLQCSGFEPLIIYNNGEDLEFSYSNDGPSITIPDGYQYTFEVKHPFSTEFYVQNSGTSTSTLTFMIGGVLYKR
jgi:hypothetical protein